MTRAGIISRLPFDVWTHPFTIVGRPAPERGKEPTADLNEVDAQALDTLGIRLLRGRMIQEKDTASTPWVAVINKTFADRHFPGQDPVGQAIRISIGPAGDGAVHRAATAGKSSASSPTSTYPSFSTEKPAAIYIPFRQHLSQYGREDEWIHTRKVLAVRTSVDPLTLVRPIQDALAHVDRDQAAHDFMTMDQRVTSSASVTNSRFFASLFTTFGTLAILLAMVGVYGVMSWVVGQRTTEFGIRMALGARARDVVAMLMTQSLKPIGIGIVIGVLGGFGLSRGLNAMFWRMTSVDPLVMGHLCRDARRRAAGCVGASAPRHPH